MATTQSPSNVRSQLRDINLNRGQYAPGIVMADDGLLYVVAQRMPHGMHAVEDYPDLSPVNTLAAPDDPDSDDAITQQNRRAIRELEDIQLEHPLSQVTVNGTSIICRASPVSWDDHLGFRVFWQGSNNRWKVARGKYRSYEAGDTYGSEPWRPITTAPTYLAPDSGFITVRVHYTPQLAPDQGDGTTQVFCTLITFDPPKLSPVSQLAPKQPTREMNSGGPGVINITWRRGHFDIPIAAVMAPGYKGRLTPRIIRMCYGQYYDPQAEIIEGQGLAWINFPPPFFMRQAKV